MRIPKCWKNTKDASRGHVHHRLNLADNQLAHIKGCKGTVEKWKTFYNIHETKTLSNILFIHCKFFTYKIQESGDLLDYVNKVKTVDDQFDCLKVFVKDKDIFIILIESLPMKELMIDYLTVHLMYDMLKRKEKNLQDEDAVMVLLQDKNDNLFSREGAKLCFYCGKPGHIARFCYKTKNKE